MDKLQLALSRMLPVRYVKLDFPFSVFLHDCKNYLIFLTIPLLVDLLQAVPQSASSLSPSEILIAIHGIDPEKDSVPLKKVISIIADINLCLESLSERNKL